MKKLEKILTQNNDIANIVIYKTIVEYISNENLENIIIHRKHNKIFFKLNHSTNKCGTNCAIYIYLKEGSTFEDNQNIFGKNMEVKIKDLLLQMKMNPKIQISFYLTEA